MVFPCTTKKSTPPDAASSYAASSRAQFDLDWEAYVLSKPFLSCMSSSVPSGTHLPLCYLQVFGRCRARCRQSFMYDTSNFDPSRLKQGLFESDLMVFVRIPAFFLLYTDTTSRRCSREQRDPSQHCHHVRHLDCLFCCYGTHAPPHIRIRSIIGNK